MVDKKVQPLLELIGQLNAVATTLEEAMREIRRQSGPAFGSFNQNEIHVIATQALKQMERYYGQQKKGEGQKENNQAEA